MADNVFLLAAVIAFAVGAVFGLSMAALHFARRRPPPMTLAVLHGIFVLSGFAMLLGAVFPSFSGRPALALAVFAVAAVGGSAMVLGWRSKPLPSGLVLVHGGVALIAFAILLTAFFGL